MNNNDFKKMMTVKNLEGQNYNLSMLLSNIKLTCHNVLAEIKMQDRKKYTEEYALFSVENGKYKFLRIIDTSIDEEYDDSEMSDATIIMRLPQADSIEEFEGF